MTENEIPVFFALDNRYAPYADVAIRSLIENASKEYQYQLIVIHQDLTEENQKRLGALSTKNAKVQFVSMKNGLESITDRKENQLNCDYFTLTIYFRLFIPEMFPQYDKGIYIDSDITVPGDISELYHIDLKGNIIGACPDFSIAEVPELQEYTTKAIGMAPGEYINSGVLLMNLKMMREKHFSENFLRLLNEYHFDTIAPDQDYINAMCNGKIHFLDESWDAMPNKNRAELPNPNLVHYNLFAKPWKYSDIPYEDYFWEYAKDSDYYQDIITAKNNYSKEQQESDSNCFQELISRGYDIASKENTFKKIYDAGEKIRI